MFGKKKPAPKPVAAEDDEHDAKAVAEVVDESAVELKAEALAPKASTRGGWMWSAVGMGLVTVISAGGGVGLGTKTAASVEQSIADREAQIPAADHPLTAKYSNDTVVRAIEPVITNLASPTDTWIRLETAMVFKNGALANPDVTAAELRQDEVAYLRTLPITALEGPSALQHLREDLNERASLRTAGKVSELVIQTMIVQ